MGKCVYDCALFVGLTNLWWLSYKYGAKICRQIIKGQRSRSANQRRQYKSGPIKDVYIVFGVDL